MKNMKIILVVLCIFTCTLFSSFSLIRKANSNNDIDFLMKMGPGWNLGNSLDCHNVTGNSLQPEDFETYWTNPVTTQKIIDQVKNAGFQTVRIPVTWYEHLDSNGVIDKDWLNRVQEVVDYVIADDMYAILDLHHENWSSPTYKNKEYGGKLLQKIWIQLADRFKNYDEHLLFECINEPRLVGTNLEWLSGNEESWNVINSWNQIFVDTIRNSGGYNKNRYLLLPTYCNSFSQDAIDAFKLPKGKHLIVTVHAYVPTDFALNKEGTAEWNAAKKADTIQIDTAVNNLYNSFIRKGIPVIIGEFGALDKGNDEARAAWTEYFVQAAKNKKLMYIWWDDGGDGSKGNHFSLLNRNTMTWKFPIIMKELTEQQ